MKGSDSRLEDYAKSPVQPQPRGWVRCSLSPVGSEAAETGRGWWPSGVSAKTDRHSGDPFRSQSHRLAPLPHPLPCCSQSPVISLIFAQSLVLSLSPPPDCELTTGPSTELTNSRCSVHTCREEGREKGGEGETRCIMGRGVEDPSGQCASFPFTGARSSALLRGEETSRNICES